MKTFASVILIAAIATETFGGGSVVTENSSLENWKNGVPEWWHLYWPKKKEIKENSISEDSTVFHSGAKSAKIAYFKPVRSGLQINKYGVKLVGGKKIRLSVWFRTSEGVSSFSAGIHFYDSKRKHLDYVRVTDKKIVPGIWTLLEKEIDTPKEATQMGVSVYPTKGGATWVDDLSVSYVDYIPPKPMVVKNTTGNTGKKVVASAEKTPVAPKQEKVATPEFGKQPNCQLIRNGGFESGGAKIAWWHLYWPDKKKYPKNIISADSKIKRFGKRSLRLDYFNQVKAGLQVNRYDIPVVGGSDITVSFWARVRGVNRAEVGLHFYDSKSRHIGYVRVKLKNIPSGEWRKLSKNVSVPKNAVRCGFALYSMLGGTTWFDDVSLFGVPKAESLRGTPKVDGVINDSCWTDANLIADFANNKTGEVSKRAVKVWTACDDKAFHLAFDVEKSLDPALKTDALKRDGQVWKDDSMEFFIMPALDGRFVQLVINSKGVVFDSKSRNSAWNASAKSAVKVYPDHWTGEISIPLADLDYTINTTGEWRFNAAYNNRSEEGTVAWSRGGFHAPARFGKLKMPNVNLRPFLEEALSSRMRTFISKLNERQARLESLKVLKPANKKRLLATFSEIIEKAKRLKTDASIPLAEMLKRFGELEKSLNSEISSALANMFISKDGGFRLILMDVTRKVMREREVALPPVMFADKISLSAARDETECFQFVLESIANGGALRDVVIEPLTLKKGDSSISAEFARVDYVETNPPKGFTPIHVGWLPDILVPCSKPFNVAKNSRQPVWGRFNVPPDAAPGVYSGELTVKCGGGAVSVPVSLRVRSFVLPRPGHLVMPWGNYASLIPKWYFNSSDYRSKLPKKVFREWCAFLGKYRLSAKNIANEYVDFKKLPNGTSECDVSSLNETLAPLYPKFVTPFGFSMYRISCSKKMRSGEAGEYSLEPLKAKLAAYHNAGLPEKAYIYGVDEVEPKAYGFVKNLYAAVKKVAPKCEIMQTGLNAIPKPLVGVVDIWCPLTPNLSRDHKFYAERKKAGDTLWMYVCVSPQPPYANFYIDEPGVDHRVIFWQAWKRGVTGLLYWSTTWWGAFAKQIPEADRYPRKPFSFADLKKPPSENGDGILIWPGPNMTPYPSIRLEILRDGIEDYEYLAILADEIKRVRGLENSKSARILSEAEKLSLVPQSITKSMTDFSRDPGNIVRRREQIADMIEKLRTIK